MIKYLDRCLAGMSAEKMAEPPTPQPKLILMGILVIHALVKVYGSAHECHPYGYTNPTFSKPLNPSVPQLNPNESIPNLQTGTAALPTIQVEMM